MCGLRIDNVSRLSVFVCATKSYQKMLASVIERVLLNGTALGRPLMYIETRDLGNAFLTTTTNS
jgi:hypothetical protein